MRITSPAIWINPGVGVLTIIALWPVAIMFMHVRNTLRSLKIIPKYAMYQVSRSSLIIHGFSVVSRAVFPNCVKNNVYLMAFALLDHHMNTKAFHPLTPV